MNVSRIKIKPYLREFLIAKYGEEPVRFPESSPIVSFIHEFRIKRPASCKEGGDELNLSIYIPYEKYGKDPRYHNYFTPRAQQVLQQKINTVFTATFNDFVAKQVHEMGLRYADAYELFKEMYGLDSITIEGLKQKNFRDRARNRYLAENKFKKS